MDLESLIRVLTKVYDELGNVEVETYGEGKDYGACYFIKSVAIGDAKDGVYLELERIGD